MCLNRGKRGGQCWDAESFLVCRLNRGGRGLRGGWYGNSQIPIQSVLQSFEKKLILPNPIRVIRVIRDSDNTYGRTAHAVCPLL